MKNLLLVLIVGVCSLSTTQAQCAVGEHDCWISEAVANIDASDFDRAERSLRKSKRKATRIQKDLAKKLKSKLKNIYKPLIGHREASKEKRNGKFYKEALQHLSKGKTLAERNTKSSVDATEELDQALVEYFESNLPIVEEERIVAIEDSNEKAESFYNDGNYRDALLLFEFVERETLNSESLKSEASKKANVCKFNIAYQKAGDALDSDKFKLAYDFSNTALKYNSSDIEANLEVKRIRDEARKELYKSKITSANEMVDGGDGTDCEKAIKIYEDAKQYYTSDLSNEGLKSPIDGITEAKGCASKHYLKLAINAHESNNYNNVPTYLDKAKYFSPTAKENYKGYPFNHETLLNKFFEEKKDDGDSLYVAQKYDLAIKSFKAASTYKAKVQMENKKIYVEAIEKAMQLEANKKGFSKSGQYYELAEAWNQAKKLQSAAKIYQGPNPTKKYNDFKKDGERLARRESSKYNNKMLNKEIRYSQIQLQRVSFNKNEINVSKTRDDHSFGGGANIWVSVSYRRNPDNLNILQVKFHVKLLEEKGHCCDNTNTTYETTSNPINILKIPSKFKGYTIDNNWIDNFKSKFYFTLNNTKLNGKHIKGRPDNMYLDEKTMGFLINTVLKWDSKEGIYKLSFQTFPKKVSIIKESEYYKSLKK